MFSWFYKWSEEEIFKLIDKVDETRKERRCRGSTMSSSFAQDLKSAIKGNLVTYSSDDKSSSA